MPRSIAPSASRGAVGRPPERLAVIALLAAACATSGPSRPAAPPPEQAAAYYPLEPGWKWAYAIEQGGQIVLATYVVLDRVGQTVAVQAGDDRIHYELRPDGIVRKEALGVDDYLIKGPVRAGATWQVSGGTAKVVATNETVQLDAGRFEGCAIVEERRRSPERVTRTTFAPGIGPVRIEVDVEGAPPERVRAVLRGYTKPGQDPLS
jgi:hypothetical protein